MNLHIKWGGRAIAGSLSLGLSLAAQPAWAQQAAEEPQQAGGDAIVVSASRSGEGVSAGQLGASVTVIDAAALEQRQTRVVSDVLRDVPGVAVSRTGAVGGLTQVRLRGAEGNHVLVLIDGMEAADPYNGEYDFGGLIADPAARIEVLRGQQSSLYGSDAIGGVVHYITLTGAEAPGFSGRVEGGSFGTINGGARVAGVSGDVDYAFSGSFFHTGGYPTARGGVRDVGSDVFAFSSKLIWSPAENFRLTGVARYNRVEADSNNSENNGASPLFGLTVDSPGVGYESEILYGLVSAELTALDGRWTNVLSGQIADSTRDAYDPAGRTSGNTGQRLKGSFTSSIALESGDLVHRLTGGVDVERESFRNTSPSPFAFTGERHTDNIGLVGQYELTLGETLGIGASVRRDENNRFDDVTTYRVQGSYRFASGTRVRGAWGTGVKNPGYFELYGFSDGRYIGNPNLRPEKSEGWEAGLEQSFGDAATIGATYFDSTLEGEIFTTYPPPTFIATPANRATVSKQRGVEVFARAQPSPQFRLDGAYTYLKARENGVVEVRRPKHIASVNATVLSADQRFSGTLTVRYNGEQTDVTFTDPTYATTPIVTLDDYVLVNLSAEYRVSDGISITGRVENLLDQDYEEVFSFATPGLSAYGGVRLRF